MTAQNTKSRIASGFYRVIERLGGMSDTLSIAGSYGDTLTDEQVADELEAWLAANPLRPQPSGETREAVARLTAGLESAHPNHKTMFVYVDDLRQALALLSARPLALGGQQGEGGDRVNPSAMEGFAYVPLKGGAYPAELIEYLNGYITGGSGRCRESLEGMGVLFGTTPARAEAQDEGAAGELAILEQAVIDASNGRFPPQGQADDEDALDGLAHLVFKRRNARAHPSPTPAADADRVREAIADVISHENDWRTALTAMDAAEETPEDGSGKPGYWLHQIKVLDRIVSAFKVEGK